MEKDVRAEGLSRPCGDGYKPEYLRGEQTPWVWISVVSRLSNLSEPMIL